MFQTLENALEFVATLQIQGYTCLALSCFSLCLESPIPGELVAYSLLKDHFFREAFPSILASTAPWTAVTPFSCLMFHHSIYSAPTFVLHKNLLIKFSFTNCYFAFHHCIYTSTQYIVCLNKYILND